MHTLFLRWLTGASRTTHRRALIQAAGSQPIGAHWDSQTSAFWNKLAGMSDSRLARLAFKDNIALMLNGGECWASRSVQLFSDVGALGPTAIHHPGTPLWDHQVSVAQGIAESNQAFWDNFCQNPRLLPAHPVSLPHRTLYTFAAWFRQMSDGLHVHHNVPARHWKSVLRFCLGRHKLACKSALWHKTPLHECLCPCCGAGPEDEAHLVLECPAYQSLRSKFPSIFGALPSDTCLAMQQVFKQAHFRDLSSFLSSCFALRQGLVESGVTPLAAPAPLPHQPIIPKPPWPECLMLSLGIVVAAAFLFYLLFSEIIPVR